MYLCQSLFEGKIGEGQPYSSIFPVTFVTSKLANEQAQWFGYESL